MLGPYSDKYLLSIFAQDMVFRKVENRNFVPVKRTGFYESIMKTLGELASNIAVRYRTRKIEAELEVLSDHMLDDIGVKRANIHSVAVKWAAHEAHPANDDHNIKAA
jgi:uncharacterized protein YjiS (DUF1127 family)